MTRGKRTCKILKQIRQEIADRNEIAYSSEDCHFEGECLGTCPKCEAELKYIENELHKRKQLGKTAAIAGISLGIAGTFSACNAPQQTNKTDFEQEIIMEMPEIAIIPDKKDSDVINLTVGKVDTLDGNLINIPIDTIVPIVTYEDFSEFLTGLVISEEHPPMYLGGEKTLIKFIQYNLTYPKKAKKHKIEGEVWVGFVVEEDGSLTNFTINKSVHPLLDKEALRLAKLMDKWIPARNEMGKPIRTQYNMPVIFSLEENKN